MAVVKNLLWHEGYLRRGLRIPLDWDMEAAPHMCCFGSTGSGKTYLLKLALGKIVRCDPTAQLTVCDGKGGDFDFLSGCERYASVAVTPVFNGFYDAFLARQRGGVPDKAGSRVLLFDEWSAYMDSLLDAPDGKKLMEAQRRKLGNLLRLGRSYHFHVILGQQRMDSTYFSGFRENFNKVIGLSTLSRESRDMFFSEFKDQMEPDRERGTGYMTTNGTGSTPIAVPRVRDLPKLHRAILEGVIR